MHSNDDPAWAFIKSLGLKPGVDSFEKYSALTREGIDEAKSFLKRQEFGLGPYPGEIILYVHKLIFHDVHDWAGQPRKTELIIDRETRIPGSPPEHIISDLKTINDSAKGWFRSNDLQQLAKEMAAYHIALHLVHPVLDGTGRTIRTILDVQRDLLMEREAILNRESVKLDFFAIRDGYLDSCKKGVEKNDPLPLAKLILESCRLLEKANAQQQELETERENRKILQQERLHSKSR